MEYNQLHQRFGARIAQRVHEELNQDEFENIEIDDLIPHLEDRAEKAQKNYLLRLYDPLGKIAQMGEDDHFIDGLHRRWRDAEELAYLVSVTGGDMSFAFRAQRTG